MGWLTSVAGIFGATIGVVLVTLAVLAKRQGAREAGFVEMLGGETILGLAPPPDPPPYAERRDKPVTDVAIWLASNSLMDHYGATAAMHAAREAKRTRDQRDREI